MKRCQYAIFRKRSGDGKRFNTYEDTALSGETVSMESQVEVKEGKVTVLRPGEVTITANIGNTVVECIIIVKASWKGTY